jgi:hypothetical protein
MYEVKMFKVLILLGLKETLLNINNYTMAISTSQMCLQIKSSVVTILDMEHPKLGVLMN